MQGLGHHTVRVLDDGCVEVVCELPGCNKASAIDVDIDGLNIVIEVEDGCRLELYTTLVLVHPTTQTLRSVMVPLPCMVDEEALHCKFDKATGIFTVTPMLHVHSGGRRKFLLTRPVHPNLSTNPFQMTMPELEVVPLVIIDETDSEEEAVDPPPEESAPSPVVKPSTEESVVASPAQEPAREEAEEQTHREELRKEKERQRKLDEFTLKVQAKREQKQRRQQSVDVASSLRQLPEARESWCLCASRDWASCLEVRITVHCQPQPHHTACVWFAAPSPPPDGCPTNMTGRSGSRVLPMGYPTGRVPRHLRSKRTQQLGHGGDRRPRLGPRPHPALHPPVRRQLRL